MALGLAQDAISLLIQMAEQGEIDPWDVKVIDVIDRFLSDLAPFEAQNRAAYDSNLSQSGQAFLYASMLLLLKANTLTQAEQTVVETADYEGSDEFLDLIPVGVTGLPPFLERRLQRRATAPTPLRRRVTLTELIDQIRTIAAALDDDNPRRPKARRPKPHSRRQAIRAIAQLAHQENLSEMAAALEEFFTVHGAKISPDGRWMDFELLLELWEQMKDELTNLPPENNPHGVGPNHERVGVFWALLLLTAQSKVELAQENFYQDLRVRLLENESIAQLQAFAAQVD
jgi:segregation and condensation protein A